MRFYISGKITGIEKEAAGLFDNAESFLNRYDCSAVNPINLPHNHNKTWQSYMRECIKYLCDCDAIYMLKNWKDSTGATLEYHIAKTLDLPVVFEEDTIAMEKVIAYRWVHQMRAYGLTREQMLEAIKIAKK